MSSIMNFFKPTKKAGASSGGGQKRPASDSAASPTEKKVCASRVLFFFICSILQEWREVNNIIVPRSIYIFIIFFTSLPTTDPSTSRKTNWTFRRIPRGAAVYVIGFNHTKPLFEKYGGINSLARLAWCCIVSDSKQPATPNIITIIISSVSIS